MKKITDISQEEILNYEVVEIETLGSNPDNDTSKDAEYISYKIKLLIGDTPLSLTGTHWHLKSNIVTDPLVAMAESHQYLTKEGKKVLILKLLHRELSDLLFRHKHSKLSDIGFNRLKLLSGVAKKIDPKHYEEYGTAWLQHLNEVIEENE